MPELGHFSYAESPFLLKLIFLKLPPTYKHFLLSGKARWL